jgi:hypothetical protein
MIFDVNGGVGNQLFHPSTALAFDLKFKVNPELNLRGCDTSRGGEGNKWQLGKFVQFLQRDFNLSIRRSRNIFEDSYLKFIDKVNKPTYIDKNQIENLFDKPTLSDRKLFIPHIESKIISKFALQNGFAEIVREYRSLLSKDQLISSPSQGAVALHLRRMDSNTGLNGLDSWYLRNEWYEKVLRTFYSKTDNLFCFTNSLLEAEFLREICPDVRVFGPEISPLNTILSISTFNNLILSRSTLSYWAGEVSSAQNIYSAFPSTHNFSPNNSYNFVPPL